MHDIPLDNYKHLLSVQGNGNKIFDIVTQIIAAGPDYHSKERKYIEAIKKLIAANDFPALKACLQNFPPVETMEQCSAYIYSPFEILVYLVPETATKHLGLLKQIMAFLEQNRPDLLTYCAFGNESILNQIWLTVPSLDREHGKGLEYFKTIFTQYTYPTHLVMGLYELLKEHISLESEGGRNQLVKYANSSTVCIGLFAELYDMVEHLALPVSNSRGFQWFMDNPTLQGYLRFEFKDPVHETQLIWDVMDDIIGTMPDMLSFDATKGFVPNASHPLVVMVEHGISTQHMGHALADYCKKNTLSKEQVEYVQRLSVELGTVEQEMTSTQTLVSASHAFAAAPTPSMSPVISLLTKVCAYLPVLNLIDPLVTANKPSATHFGS